MTKQIKPSDFASAYFGLLRDVVDETQNSEETYNIRTDTDRQSKIDYSLYTYVNI